MDHITELAVRKLIEKIRTSRKYNQLDIPESTLLNLFEIVLAHQKSLKEADEIVRHKLHNIMAPYLGDPDYDHAFLELKKAFTSGNPLEIKAV